MAITDQTATRYVGGPRDGQQISGFLGPTMSFISVPVLNPRPERRVQERDEYGKWRTLYKERPAPSWRSAQYRKETHYHYVEEE